MDERDWLILKTVAEVNNMTKAAEQLFISQPALTYRMNQIELHMNVTILERRKKGIVFTEEGKHLVKYANEMLHRLQQMREELASMKDRTKGMIRLGVSSNFARVKLPTMLQHFLEQYPDVQFSVMTGWSEDVYKRLVQGDLRMAIVRGEHHWPHEKLLLEKEALVIISKEPIDVSELPSQPRITYQTDPSLQQLIDAWWQEQFAVPPHITMEIDNIETCKKLVTNGLGYAIVPSLGLNETTDSLYIHALQTTNGLSLERESWLLFKQADINETVAGRFIEFLQDEQ